VRRKRLLKVKNIETLYGLIMAIRGVSLEVQEGQIAAILGANGAGKTTILKTIMGLLEDQPDKGTIEFLGKRIDGKDAEEIVHLGISYVPEGREVFPELSVDENLKMGAYTRKDKKGVKVLILRRECALVSGRHQKKPYKVEVEQGRCLGESCGCNRLCTRIFKCPGLMNIGPEAY
jgi:ABC-type multidrug transport system ATPase subunit